MSRSSGSAMMMDDDDNYAMQGDEVLSDDDNAAPDMQSEADDGGEKEDPLLLAIDDLEGRVVSALDDVKLHPGVRSSSTPGSPTVHEELSTLLRPVLEVAAHTGPSVARTYYHGIGSEGVEVSCEDVYQRVVSDLVLPVILEMAQSDTIPAKRAASLEFFKHLFQECQKAGSWLDATTTGPQMGPYGSGSMSSSSHSVHAINNPAARAQQKRRLGKKLAREGEILRYWVTASIACTVQGVFTSEASETAVASRGIIAASSSLRPSLKHIAQRIKATDDRGATKLYVPVMKMVEGVLKKLFLSSPEETAGSGDAVRASSIKFLEILTLVCSRKPQDPSQRRRGHVSSDFSLEDLPSGHPIITKESLEEISEYSFATLRGLALLGGQVKIDANVLSDMLLSVGHGSPAAQVVSILKPAALAYLEIESSLPSSDDENALEITLDRSNIEFDFILSQKPYSLTLNSMSALGLNRPMFFKESALSLARRAIQPPVFVESGVLTKSGVLAITAHLKASCLTLLRNALSVSTNASGYLHEALLKCDMEIQADKALGMATQANSLKTAGRAARNRANMFYEWDATEDKRSSKRQRDTDDALAKIRAAKKARGLGNGIQLPQNMADAVELVMENLTHLPSKRPPGAASKIRKTAVTLDFVVDAILTNGASLAQEEGRWYDRDGGETWSIQWDSEQKYELSNKFLGKMEGPNTTSTATKTVVDGKTKDPKALFQEQAGSAASDAVGRIVMQSMNTRSKHHSEFGNEIAARLAWTLKNVKAPAVLAASSAMAIESFLNLSKKFATVEEKESLAAFLNDYPIVNGCLALDSTPTTDISVAGQDRASGGDKGRSLSDHILYEAYAQTDPADVEDGENATKYRKYEHSVGMSFASVVRAGQLTDEKTSSLERKQGAAHALSTMLRVVGAMPKIFPSSLEIAGALCDVAEISKKATDAARKSSQQTIAASAALHAAKAAAEKRATAILLVFRDVAFTRSHTATRRGAVDCAVMVASGSLPASQSIEDKALKLVMNVLFPKSDLLASCVLEAASSELIKASTFAESKYDEIAAANKENADKKEVNSDNPSSDVEREVMEKVKKPALLLMALCVRRPEIIKTLFEVSCRDKADALHKAVRVNMSKMAKAAAAKHGTAAIARKVAEMASDNEASLVLAFLDNLASSTDKNSTIGDDFIEACHEIQALKAGKDGKKDPRYIIPIVSAIKRTDLVEKLPEFVKAEDSYFLAALERMGDRTARQALLYRDEPDEETPSLKGMTLCEQLVFLHNLDFAAAGLPQKRYLDAISLCLDNDKIYSDRVVMSALDHMSGVFLTGAQGLPLAYMRTIILVCSKHESLHSWITSVLLPRLVEGKIADDRRQWQGFLRVSKMLGLETPAPVV